MGVLALLRALEDHSVDGVKRLLRCSWEIQGIVRFVALGRHRGCLLSSQSRAKRCQRGGLRWRLLLVLNTPLEIACETNSRTLAEQNLKAKNGGSRGFAHEKQNRLFVFDLAFCLSSETPLELTPDDEIKRLLLSEEGG